MLQKESRGPINYAFLIPWKYCGYIPVFLEIQGVVEK